MPLQLKDLRGLKKCKRVAINPNTKLANVDLIKETIGKIEKEEAGIKAKETKSRPERVST